MRPAIVVRRAISRGSGSRRVAQLRGARRSCLRPRAPFLLSGIWYYHGKRTDEGARAHETGWVRHDKRFRGAAGLTHDEPFACLERLPS
jgi:hypothetical protein